MATTVTAASLTVGQKIRYVAKNGTDVYKATVKEILKKEKSVKLDPIDGNSVGKTITVTEDRLKRMQGRQPGFSPAATKTDTAIPKNAGKAKAEKAAPAKAGKTGGVKKKEVTEEMDLVSCREEVKDILEAMNDLSERLSAVSEFMANLDDGSEEGEEAQEEEEEGEEEEASPAPKKRGPKAKKPMDEDED